MIGNYITFVLQQQKPASFHVNKGRVKVVNSNENFWIKYSSDFGEHVQCSMNGGVLNVMVDKDDMEIIVNLTQLQECNVKLDSGVMNVHHLCKKSNMFVGNGNLKAHVSKVASGKINAHVDVGVLTNNSDLIPQQHHDNNLGMFNFNPWAMIGGGNNGMNQSILLAGNVENYDANFSVHNGVLDIGM